MSAPSGTFCAASRRWCSATLCATGDYRALTQRVLRDADVSLADGATPYEVMIFTLVPVFAAHDEETVTAVVPPNDGEGNEVRR